MCLASTQVAIHVSIQINVSFIPVDIQGLLLLSMYIFVFSSKLGDRKVFSSKLGNRKVSS